MPDNFDDLFQMDHTSELEFKEAYGFIFVFETSFISINDMLSSAEIRPLGIIYEENDEFYYAPLDNADNIDMIIREFVDNYMLK